eukprot:253998-Rhodomonas_salina.1
MTLRAQQRSASGAARPTRLARATTRDLASLGTPGAISCNGSCTGANSLGFGRPLGAPRPTDRPQGRAMNVQPD